MSHIRIVTKPEQAVENIRSFQSEIEANGRENELVRTLSHFRSWYVLSENGVALYAPSKWIGYASLTAEEYAKNNANLDGRKTEAALHAWFAEVPAGPEYDRLMEGLNDYLAGFGKKPSTLARVSVLREGRSEGTSQPRLADALLALYRSLPQTDQQEFRRLIKKEM